MRIACSPAAPRTAPTPKGLKEIADAARRAAALTRQLLMFSRKQVIQPKVLDLNAVLQNLANMLMRLLGEDIRLESSYAPNLPQIEADTGMLEQVVMNLAVNSRDAMPKGGQLSMGTASVEIDEGYASQHPESRPGTFVCLTVTDTGCGMDRQTLDRIFEPFFSTKEVGKGTGLGLATVYGIVKQHHGWIEVTSQVGCGTTFKIYFPAATRQTDATADILHRAAIAFAAARKRSSWSRMNRCCANSSARSWASMNTASSKPAPGSRPSRSGTSTTGRLICSSPTWSCPRA